MFARTIFILRSSIPDTLQPLPDGEYGELVFTCIGKEALPLIRYRTRDICALNHETCACGRTTVRMTKPRGRSDDMLIIRGVNVFPSQVEHVLLELGMDPNYLILVDRKNNLDVMEVQVEMNAALFSDTVRDLESTEKRIEGALQSTLNVHARVRLMEPAPCPVPKERPSGSSTTGSSKSSMVLRDLFGVWNCMDRGGRGTIHTRETVSASALDAMG